MKFFLILLISFTSFAQVYPPSIPSYASDIVFPSAFSVGNGQLALALDTDTLWISDGLVWEILATPGTVGTVTSVGLAAPTIFTVSGSPVTSSGTLTLSYGSGFLPIANGGTNAGTAANAFANLSPLTTAGDIIYETAVPAPARLAIGSSGNVLTVSGGLPVWSPPATSGTVTSIGMTVPSVFSVSPSSITTSGTFSLTYSGTALPVLNGGTGQTTAAAAFNALSPITTTGDMIYSPAGATSQRLAVGSSGNVLTVSGGVPTWSPPATSGTVTTLSVVSSNGFAGTVANATSTPAITLTTTATGILQGNGTAISAASTTGSGNVVLATSPSLTTPAIGAATGTSLQLSGLTASQAVVTDASKNLASLAYTNANTASTLVERDTSGNFSAGTITATLVGNASTATTVTTNANLTGPITSSGNATSIASQTGTGSTFVMSASPTITTPAIVGLSGGSFAGSGDVGQYVSATVSSSTRLIQSNPVLGTSYTISSNMSGGSGMTLSLTAGNWLIGFCADASIDSTGIASGEIVAMNVAIATSGGSIIVSQNPVIAAVAAQVGSLSTYQMGAVSLTAAVSISSTTSYVIQYVAINVTGTPSTPNYVAFNDYQISNILFWALRIN